MMKMRCTSSPELAEVLTLNWGERIFRERRASLSMRTWRRRMRGKYGFSFIILKLPNNATFNVQILESRWPGVGVRAEPALVIQTRLRDAGLRPATVFPIFAIWQIISNSTNIEKSQKHKKKTSWPYFSAKLTLHYFKFYHNSSTLPLFVQSRKIFFRSKVWE